MFQNLFADVSLSFPSTSDAAVFFQSPVLGESASMYYNSKGTEGFSQNGEIPDHRFYQELLVRSLSLSLSNCSLESYLVTWFIFLLSTP